MHTLAKRIVLVGYLCAAIYVISPSFLKASQAQAGPQTVAAIRSDATTAQCPDAKESSLPLPSSMSPDAFHDKLLAFLQSTEYVTLKWCVDKGVRDTGPFVNGYLGVHPAVRIYYSPAVMNWLVNGRIADIPDGAMIVKEMYNPGPAARYEGKQLTPASWTVMIKDSKG